MRQNGKHRRDGDEAWVPLERNERPCLCCGRPWLEHTEQEWSEGCKVPRQVGSEPGQPDA